MGRVEDHLGDRLRGRAIPDDLRRLAELELDGVLRGQGSVPPFAEVHVLTPGQLHPLLDPQYQQGEQDPGVIANNRAIDEVLGHMAVVVDGFNGDLFGYWLHPDEPATDRPAIVRLDTEGQFAVLEGETLVEAMIFDWLGYDVDQDYFARVVAFCQRHQIPLTAGSRDELRKPEIVVDPGILHDQLYRRYQPFTTRPPWADTVGAQAAADEHIALVGLRITDAPLRTWLARLGYPDPAATIATLDDGLGEVRLKPVVANADLTLYQDEDHDWWLFSVRFRRPTPQHPLQVPLPYGFSLYDSRHAVHDRFGVPHSSALLLAVDCWQFGPIVAYVRFDKDQGFVTYIEFWPSDVARRS
ncbi:hypothetical protein [Allorhizocola rhizosphaerae]|uniref:hypothetical protein n=1 Tax=Allorhizocola rhizosphaerae TaxID=1872709 RepID=UPI000E3B61F2|nr:hypothetical protein [Allorhizocola rhizosphaerae]